MKIKLDLDQHLDEPTITIAAPKMTPQIHEIYELLKDKVSQYQQIEGFKGNKAYYLNEEAILFFETDGRQVVMHTKTDAFSVKSKLYELEALLGDRFMRVSKSAILNLDKIYALTRSISNCQIQFEDTYKKVYVSRRYYRELRERLSKER